ncbi:2-dehydro-3-deoxy-6-phosphogalactonate aldolase [Agrobacterium tumefaciens]|uniref:Keto-hydroxyglutarate-aldolase/keto-deoxy-phosphogluconate aldolase n=1 Tax=Agrobacterium fabrum (strain C58 / ATCC 33970) TaxID=176299 RepID=A9CK08_AGRFC|nr:2-dehydro-3-deoxy-6-phosphogalactonate aldolase [Agrobacterium fabrum]KEY55108.1 2-dehydro-3-deoxy-6-phosphogalactonate aldolase [Agrobacterium tumefaciens]AAK86513.1 keto-hydroxyglutarate-aldolase/keto-deoxy-phosphogluconate aldolase [Agrobacterium fabrum str. C58]KJX89332.1 2-dehydro-3-deoxyphosphogalactonate aldolase [Agrobacterium tumefaciens]MCX2877154.1 2-dehydro-3-deoxy-6-phosphogalactonate aldolase [Agrobacterium fabrum]NMV68613.1 2-dehydro-3-deoxy-6-phosphogalactonate aldolase [Agr
MRIPFPSIKYPLIAILRGLKPEETEGVVGALIETGFRAIEIPLNSPDPFRSIEIAARMAPADCLIGAGTVLSVEDVASLDAAGGKLMVSPNADAEVITAAREKGMVTMPGVLTPTEALVAAKAGATGLKFFPASIIGPSGINAIRTILPKELIIAAVGGVSDKNFSDYTSAGIRAFGLGTSLYKPGMTAAEVRERATVTLAAYDAAIGG